MSAKNGRLSMLRPGKGIGAILSTGARSGPGWMVRSTRRVWPLFARYSSVSVKRRPISSSVASSISRNSIGTRSTVIVDSVTTAAAMRLIASIGSSDGKYSMSTSSRPRR